MVINKIIGMIFVIIGGIVLYALYKAEEYDMFLIELLIGPTLIYLGLKLLN